MDNNLVLNLDCENNNLLITNDEIKGVLETGPVVENNTYEIIINVTHNCCTVFDQLTFTYDDNYPIDTIDTSLEKYLLFEHETLGKVIGLKGEFYNQFIDGIYSVSILIINTTDTLNRFTVLDTSYCSLLACDLDCKLSEHLDKIIKEDKLLLNAVLYHYTLMDSRECNCHCDEQCELYNKLIDLLNDKNCRSC